MQPLVDWLVAHPDLANAFSALASAVIALCALVVAITSQFVSVKTVRMQIKHNKISVKPVPSIEICVEKDEISLKITNGGLGTLICRNFKIFDGNTAIKIQEIPEDFPSDVEGEIWSILENHPIIAGHDCIIITIRPTKTKIFNEETILFAREKLKRLCYVVEYTDLYNEKYPNYVERYDHI